jgi:hypothetical protein
MAYVVAGFVGGLITALVLWWHFGALAVLLGAPFGGSLLALVLAFVLALRRDNHSP